MPVIFILVDWMFSRSISVRKILELLSWGCQSDKADVIMRSTASYSAIKLRRCRALFFSHQKQPQNEWSHSVMQILCTCSPVADCGYSHPTWNLRGLGDKKQDGMGSCSGFLNRTFFIHVMVEEKTPSSIIQFLSFLCTDENDVKTPAPVLPATWSSQFDIDQCCIPEEVLCMATSRFCYLWFFIVLL